MALDFYNRIQVDVWEPAFRPAEAMHTVQDSFAHTIRSEADDLKKIATALNYAETRGGKLRMPPVFRHDLQ